MSQFSPSRPCHILTRVSLSTASIADGQTYNLFDFGSQTGDFSSVALTGSIVGSLFLTSTDT